MISDDIKILGIDDFPANSSGAPVSVSAVVFRGNKYMENLLSTQISQHNNDCTEKFISMINKSKISDQLTVILTDGITFAGLNILDINKLNQETGIPVIAVMDRMPNIKKIENLFHSKHIDDRISIMKLAGKIYETKLNEKNVYFQVAGISEMDASNILKISTKIGKVPEPLRVVHIIGSGMYFGSSKGGA